MEREDFVILDLDEERLLEIKELISTDSLAFVRQELWQVLTDYSRVGLAAEALSLEFSQMVKVRIIQFRAHLDIIELWTDELFRLFTLNTANYAKCILQYCFDQFLASEAFKALGHRFGMTHAELMEEAGARFLQEWFILWISKEYPNIALFLFGKNRVKPYQIFNGISVEQVVKYLPEFMVWGLERNLLSSRKPMLFRHLAEGKNIRQIKESPIAFNKRMAHYFTNAPKAFNLNQATWHGLVLGLGGDAYLRDIFARFFGQWHKDFDFLSQLIAFFARPENRLEAEEIIGLLGYLRHVHDEEGKVELSGWTIRSLGRRAAQWYHFLEQERIAQAQARMQKEHQTFWKGADYKPFTIGYKGEHYFIAQITSHSGLIAEGRSMLHCVATYAPACAKGNISIWSLRVKTEKSFKSLVTIEINHVGRIMQARGKANSAPKMNHWEIITKWARREGLLMQ